MNWIKKNLFSSTLNTVLTLVIVGFLFLILPPLFNWLFVNAVWSGTSQDCRLADGACWAFITEKGRFIFFGVYPYDEQWRPFLALVLFISTLLYSKRSQNWRRSLIWIWIFVVITVSILMKGGVLGLTPIESEKWGGLPLTMMLATGGILFAYPFGILLALARRSKMPIVRALAVGYIELIRGVPLISLLFMASVMIPLFLPEGLTFPKIFRAQMAIVLFVSAYLAEVVRGGLQAISKGQFEAAESLGLHYFHKMRLVILPQALKTVIPPTVNIFIAIFKDTTLVVIISMFDLLGTTKAVLVDPEWLGFSREAYVFLGVIFFIFCFAMARTSLKLEQSLNRKGGSCV